MSQKNGFEKNELEETYAFEGLTGIGKVILTLAKDQRVYTLIGGNGVGKTKCLEALFQYHFLGQRFSKPLLSNRASLIFSQVKLDGESLLSEQESTERTICTFSDEQKLQPTVFIGAGLRGQLGKDQHSNRDSFGTSEERRANYLRHVLDEMEENFTTLGREPSGLDDWFVKRAQSASPYLSKKDNRRVEITTLINLLHRIDSQFDVKEIEVEIEGDNTVKLWVSGELKKLSELSSGFASLVKIFQAIISGYGNLTNESELTKVEGKVFIDEIESHLHSEWQSKIIPILKESFPNTTFFITTHSPLVLTQLSEGEAYQLKRNNESVTSTLIPKPNNQLLAELLIQAFDVNLNDLKTAHLQKDDQSKVKAMMDEYLPKKEDKA